jgi:hypothetical protein
MRDAVGEAMTNLDALVLPQRLREELRAGAERPAMELRGLLTPERPGVPGR